ncbi:MAG TPA: hypothetical protein P5137_01585 [Candidatus Brocadiia bacterium]|nr:hypothetical protein [Candidatus Brocadiia bacterium]
MANLIRALLQNFTLTLFILGLIAAAISLRRKPRPLTRPIVAEALLSHFLLFSIAISYLYNFVMHVFFGEMTARFIGWAQSPFQAEVGFASLGFAAVGFLAWRGGRQMRVAAVVGPSCFLLGAAGGHIVEIVKSRNFAPGNAGVILYTDILLPLIGFAMLWLTRKSSDKTPVAVSWVQSSGKATSKSPKDSTASNP